MLKKLHIRYFNFRLLIYIGVLCVVGYLVIKSAVEGTAQDGIQKKQLLGVALGIGAMIFTMLFDYHMYIKLFPFIYIANIVLLLLVRFMGVVVNNSKRWVNIAGVQFQPSELSKIALIIFFAVLMFLLNEKINNVFVLLLMFALGAVPWILILKQPDLSTTVVCIMTFLIMLYVANISYKWILGALGVTIPAAVWFFVNLLKEKSTILPEYQKGRILAFLYPERYPSLYYQQGNSITAIASGGLMGKGLNNETYLSVKAGNFLSEAQTDFIYAIVGEEMGFTGACAIIILELLIVVECLYVSKKSSDLTGRLIACGVAGMVGFQSFVNIGVATGVLPNTGVPLPFVSYGLSSLISLFMAVGVVLNIGMQREMKKEGVEGL